MKRLLLFLIIFPFVINLSAQNHLMNHYTIGIAYEKTTENPEEALFKFRKYWGIELRASYKFYFLKNMFVTPEIDMFYEKHKVTDFIPWDGSLGVNPDDPRHHAYGIGVGISPKAGYTLPVYDISSWDFYTGPVFNINIDQHQHYRDEYWTTDRYGDKVRRASLFWNFGVALRLWDVSIFGEYNIRLTRLIKFKDSEGYGFGSNTFAVGVAYNF